MTPDHDEKKPRVLERAQGCRHPQQSLHRLHEISAHFRSPLPAVSRCVHGEAERRI